MRDVDGHGFIDWTSALGASTLGYRQLPEFHEGLSSLPHVVEVEFAERLTAILPGAEQVKFASSGTEACMAAMATARAVTGKTVIVTSDQSYHGWSDHYRAVKPDHPGVPEPMTEWIRTFRYNDLGSLRAAVRGGDVAAVMMEPCLLDPPLEGFLEGVRDLTHAAGALLVFDEMLLGGRLALGGGSQYFGIVPDLSTWGKAFGGGYPLGILAGAERYMQHALFMSGTFCGHPVSMAAGLEVLHRYETEQVIAKLWDVGTLLMQAVRGAIATTRAPLTVTGYPILPVLKWTIPDPELLLQSLLQQELADRGVLIHASGRLLPTAAHDDAALIHTARAFQEALRVIHDAIFDKIIPAGADTLQTLVRPLVRGTPARQSGIRKPAWEVLGG